MTVAHPAENNVVAMLDAIFRGGLRTP